MKQSPRISIGMGDIGDIGIGYQYRYRFFKVISVTSGSVLVTYRLIGNIPINRYRYGDFPNRYRFLEIDPYRYQYRYIGMIPIYLYDTHIQIYDADIPNRYRYPPYRTDTGFILIFFIQIPIPGIGTWYR